MQEMYYTLAADGADELEAAGVHVRGDPRGDAAAVRVGLAALGLRYAGQGESLPFLSEQAKRNILGENARRLFKL